MHRRWNFKLLRNAGDENAVNAELIPPAKFYYLINY